MLSVEQAKALEPKRKKNRNLELEKITEETTKNVQKMLFQKEMSTKVINLTLFAGAQEN